MTRTVLVTGGSGFTGSYIARLLAERGDRVINFDIREPSPEAAWWLQPVAERIHFVQGNISDWTDVIATVRAYQPEGIIHVAAIVGAEPLSQRPALALRVNIEGTFNILETARLFGIQRVVYFSSTSVLPSVQYEPIDVNHPLLLATAGPGGGFYAASKVASEALCWAYHKSFGLDFVILRPAAIYGFGMKFPAFIKPMVENSVSGLPTRLATGQDFPRDYTHVLDIAEFAMKALDVPADQIRDRVFYVATGRPLVTTGQVAEIVRSLIPGADIEIGAGLSEADRLEMGNRGVFDIRNAQEQLGYQPRFADVRDGVANYVATFRRYLKGWDHNVTPL